MAAPAMARLDAAEPRARSCRALAGTEPATASGRPPGLRAATVLRHRRAGLLSAFLIPPGTRHRAIGELRALVAAIPAADDEDEYVDA